MKASATLRQLRTRYFEAEVLRDYYEWRAKPSTQRFAGIRYRGMITRFGALRAIKRLLKSESNGKKKEAFGAEWLVLNPDFRPLFTPAELAEARRRTKKEL